jgi:hypothetical protein
MHLVNLRLLPYLRGTYNLNEIFGHIPQEGYQGMKVIEAKICHQAEIMFGVF